MSDITIRDTTATIAAATARAAGPRRGMPPWLRWGSWVPTLITFVIAAVLWQVIAWTNPYVLPSLGDIGASLIGDASMYWSNFLVTLLEVVVGAAAGILAGFLLAVVMTEFQIIERAVMPLVIIVMVTPIVAIAPALVVAFGFGMVPKFIVTGLVVFFPMLVNSLAGLRDVDQRALDVFTTLHASRWEIFRELRFPGSMPYVFAGLRIALPMAVVGAAVAEFVAAGQQAGLGSLVTTSAAQANLPVTWGAITLLAITGVLLIVLLALVRGRLLWWSDGEVTAKG
ncbi:ABC transporter permease [Microbacterium arabinogalactanolyticum]|uniref:ABC transporter permease n=1 Tax=Microbacterium arabinogalactanolyticum TaxID=69365 RepID=UPI002554CB56|nr:ABC transporter permease [Microbacterium arabinogalactanolyticum]GLC86095.1 nitrate ABC transporter permease [Microbacterium arabinogalactanolyticum]